MHNRFENLMEAVLWKSRWMVLLAVFSSIVAALILMVVGTMDIVLVAKAGVAQAVNAEAGGDFQRAATSEIIHAVDAFLISTVLLIFGVGLYELFICKIHAAEDAEKSSNVLVVHSLEQLKAKIGKVIIMVLVVTFFQQALEWHYQTIFELVWLAAGILLCAVSLFLLGWRQGRNDGQ
jgi:uncharacterized membrane protein YqhA